VKIQVEEQDNWPPDCPDCKEKLDLFTGVAADGSPTVKGYRCEVCKRQFTWQTLNER
jgi:hypothetical protein